MNPLFSPLLHYYGHCSSLLKMVQLVRQQTLLISATEEGAEPSKHLSWQHQLATDKVMQAGTLVLASYSNPLNWPVCTLGSLSIASVRIWPGMLAKLREMEGARKVCTVLLRCRVIPSKLLFVSASCKSQDQLRYMCTSPVFFLRYICHCSLNSFSLESKPSVTWAVATLHYI